MKRLLAEVFLVLTAVMLSSLLAVLFFAVVPVPATPLVAIRAIESAASLAPSSNEARSVPRFEKDWIPLSEMSPWLMKAAIASEDFRFSEHSGFDFDAIRKAMKANERAEQTGRGRIRGASTISQQTAKNLFLWPGRSWLRKGLEAWFTILIEATWSKHRILEVYLNIIEFGDGVYGVEAASRRFFKKPAKALTPAEASLLIAVLPNPRRFKVERPSSYVRFRQNAIMRRLSSVELPE